MARANFRISQSLVICLAQFLCLAPYAVAAPQSAAKTPSSTKSAANAPQQMVILRFPRKKGFGRIHIGNSRDIDARGDVPVPAGAPITFFVGYDASQDLSPLLRLPPNSLRKINFRSLEIKDDQLRFLEHLTGLLSIDLSDTDVTDKGMASISKLKNLSILNLRGTLVTDNCVSQLKKIESLGALTLSLTRTTDNGLKDVASMKNLGLLDLTHTSVTDAALKWIGMAPNITNLELSFNKQVTDAGMAHLKDAKKLIELNIANTSVTIDGIKKLKTIKTLRTIVYSRNNFTALQAHSLAKTLPNCVMQEILARRNQKDDLPDPHNMFAPLH